MKHLSVKNWKEPVNKLTKVLADNSPTILTVFGAVGLVVTVGLTVRATVKATKIVEEHQDKIDKMEKPYYKAAEVASLTWKYYVPVVLAGGASLGCIIGANSINLKRNAAILAAYVATEDKLKASELGKDILKLKPEDKDERDKPSMKASDRPVIVNANEFMCKDEWSGRFFKTSMNKIHETEIKVSKWLVGECSVSLNELYGELGLDELPIGDTHGWRMEDIDQFSLEIGAEVDDVYGPVMVLSYRPKPIRMAWED